jgi:hypothetical protein
MYRSCSFLLAIAFNLIAFQRSAVAQTSASESPEQLHQQIQQLQQRLQDWAQLEVYHQANVTLQPPSVSENRVVFYGNSITQFWNLSAYFPDRPYINRGISG